MTLGQRISLYRKKLNISQEELGVRLGVSRQAVSKWETDLSAPDLNNLIGLARELGVSVTCFQTNDEGKMVDKIHEAYTEHYDGVMINAGAWTHYSYGISDALEMLECPLIELHMSNIHKREEFRHHSVISPIATGIIVGLGADVYTLGLRALADRTREPEQK